MRTVSLPDTPEHWRARAEQARVLAGQFDDLASRCKMLKVADEYETLAERAEVRLSDKEHFHWFQASVHPENLASIGFDRMRTAGARPSFRCILLVSAALLTAPAFAADPQNGEQLAKRWCAACHVVAPNQGGTTGEAPPFATIAARPSFDAAKIAYFLLAPHPKMPDMGLMRTEAEDLAAYVASLK
jgi:mono/diheme cytochrome c family protein